MASTFLSRTPSVAGDRRTHTFSFWYKRTGISDQYAHFYTTSVDLLGLVNDYLFFNFNGNVSGGYSFANNLLRDPSAWYHIVCAIDTTNATANDRLKLYLNGERLTPSYINNPSQNYESGINNTQIQVIGKRQSNNDRFLNGILAHYHFIDGTAYDASAFGQTDVTTGIWRPKLSPSVTYGTNGFFLKFASSGSMGTDSSGNGHTWSVNGNLKQSQTTPSNIFCKPNQLDYAGDVAEMEKNGLRLNTSGGGNDVAARGTFAVKSGKWYYEAKSTISAGSGNRKMVGFVDTESPVNNPRTLGGSAWKGVVMDMFNGDVYRNASAASDSGDFGDGDIVQVFMDLDNGLMYLGKNGTMLNSGNAVSAALDSGIFYSPYFCQDGGGSNNGVMDYNMGEGTFGGNDISSSNSDANGYGLFEYEPTHNSVNYYALCTKNINTYG